MSKPIIFSVIESPTHPKLSDLYQELGYEEMQFFSIRKVINALKKTRPDVIIGEFFYAFSTNYASNHICNLDSLLITLQKYPDYQPKIMVICSKKEYQYIDKLKAHYHLHHVLVQPVVPDQVRSILQPA